MRRTNSQKPEEQRFHVLIRGVFALFFFLYFYLSQDAAVSLAQHQLSLGQTSFEPFVGAVILSALLVGLQALLMRVVRLSERLYVLSFLPSAVCAVLLTAFVPYYRPSALILSAIVVVLAVIIGCCRPQREGKRSPLLAYMLQGLLLMAYMGFSGNSNDVLHYEVRTARHLNEGNYEEALSVGRRSLSTSPYLVAMRAYAMSHMPGGLGERLFRMPLLPGGSRQLYLTRADTSQILFSPDSLYRFLSGGNADSLQLVSRNYEPQVFQAFAQLYPEGPARDYWLCALLLDKDLEKFAEELPKYYEVADSVTLPRYYAEALVLSNRLRQDTVMHCGNANVLANYWDFKEKERKIPTATSRRNLLHVDYGTTYWWYYYYGRGKDPATATAVF